MVATDSGEFTAKFSSAVLSSWDFALMDRSAVKLKKELIKQELTVSIVLPLYISYLK